MDDKTTAKLYSHYRTSKIDALETASEWELSPSLFSVLKYVQRAGKKESSTKVDDLLKACWYLTYEVSREFMQHQYAKLLSDEIIENLRQCCQDYLSPIEIVEELDSSDFQSETNYPFSEAIDWHDESDPCVPGG